MVAAKRANIQSILNNVRVYIEPSLSRATSDAQISLQTYEMTARATLVLEFQPTSVSLS